MWKQRLSEKDLLKALTDNLRSRLPSSWNLRLEEQPATNNGRPDALLIVEAPNGDSATLVVETKIGLPPARVTQAVQQALSYGLGPAMVVSSFVSPTAQRILTE